jgi:hypothetical protein
VPRSRTHDRDLGIRKISSTTKVLAGGGVVFVGLFSAFLASRAPSHATSATPVTSPAQPGVSPSNDAATPVQNNPIENAPAPRAHTRSGGS